MITNFEEHTAPLTHHEIVLMHRVVDLLRSKARKGAEICNQEISDSFAPPGQSLGSARIRKIINHIRLTGLVPRLLANSKGYYISNDAREVDDYIASLHQRAGAILAVEEAIQKQKIKLFIKNEQINLFEEPPCHQRSTILNGAGTRHP